MCAGYGVYGMTTSRSEALMEQAWIHVEAGRVAQAQQLFQEIIHLQPDNAEAWMMGGVLHAQAGEAAQALECLGRALKIDPAYPDPYLHMARLQLASGQVGAAVASLRKAIEYDSEYPEAWQLLAEISARAGDAANAERAYRKLLELEPGRADVHNRLGGILSAMNRFDEAVQACSNALKIEPANPEIFANLGNVYFQQGDYPGAGEFFRQALQLAPGFAGARLNLGNTLQAMGDFQQAMACYQQLLDANPEFIEARLSLGECHLKTGEFQLALANNEAALAIRPDLLGALHNKGFALASLGRYQEALDAFRQVLETEERHVDAWLNRGLMEKKLGLFDAASDSLRRALMLSPDNADIRLSLSLLELLRGNLDDGWRFYSARKSVRDQVPVDPAALAGDISGRRILLVKDQGIGDEIFFLRFAGLLKDRGAWLACRTDSKIRSIVARIPFLDQVVTDSDEQPPVDMTLSVGDLPYLLGLTDIAALPPPVSLSVLPEARQRVESLLANVGQGPLVGVTWWAGTRQPEGTLGDRLAHREIPLELLAKILRPLNATVVILQRDPQPSELEAFSVALGREVLDMSDLNNDLEVMLALLARLDDYLGVDNTNLHLSAGLGKPCRILVPHPPEWRMQTEGSVSHWFPQFALYRQSPDSSWDSAINQLEKDVKGSLPR